MSRIAYFGYGSLVNLKSLRTPYLSAHRARLSGWRRRWQARPVVAGSFAPIENLAFLSVEPDEDAVIEGLVITDHRDSLPSLDQREVLYNRVTLDPERIEWLDDAPDDITDNCFIYAAGQPAAGNQARILRSYLDVVFQGYRQQFGERGPESFIRSTANFDLPVLEDRHDPIYPRAVQLDADEHVAFDALVPGAG